MASNVEIKKMYVPGEFCLLLNFELEQYLHLKILKNLCQPHPPPTPLWLKMSRISALKDYL